MDQEKLDSQLLGSSSGIPFIRFAPRWAASCASEMGPRAALILRQSLQIRLPAPFERKLSLHLRQRR